MYIAVTTSTPKSDAESGYYSIISSKCKKRLYFQKVNSQSDKKLKLISNVEKAGDFKKEIKKETKNGEKVYLLTKTLF